MKKEGMNPSKKERNKMVEECKKWNIKIERKGKNVKQQMAYLGKVLEPKRKEEKAKQDAEIKRLKDIQDAAKKALEEAKRKEEEDKKIEAVSVVVPSTQVK